MELELTKNTVVLRKLTKEEELKELLKDVTPQEEFDWGKPVGKEIW